MIRFFVCWGMERAAGELFNAAETVPGVKPSCSAMVLRVTLGSVRWLDLLFAVGVIYTSSKHMLLYVKYTVHGDVYKQYCSIVAFQ